MKLKPTYEELHKENEELRQIVKHTQEQVKEILFFEKTISGTYISTFDSELIDCNHAFIEMLGYSSLKEIQSLNTEKLFSQKNDSNSFINTLIKNKSLINSEIDLIRKDGEIIHCVENVVGIFDKENRLIQFQGFINNISKHKIAEDALKQSKEKYRFLVTNAYDTIWTINLEFNLTYVNDAVFQLLGYEPQELIGLNIDKYTTAESIEKMQYLIVRELSNRHHGEINNFTVEVKLLHKNGNVIDVEIAANLITNSQDELLGYQGRSINITKRKNAEKELLNNQLKLNEAQRLAKVGNFLWNTRTSEVTFSDGMYSLLKYDKVEKIDIDLINSKIHHPEDVKRIHEWFIKSLKERRNELIPKEYRLICKDGKVIEVITKANVTYEKNKDIMVFGMIQDITDQKQAERKLYESEKRFKGLAGAAFEALFISENGICLEQNASAEKMFGYTLEEAVGKRSIDWIAPEDRDLVEQRMKSGYEKQYVVSALKKDGTRFFTEIRGKMMQYEGRTVRASALFDITERLESERELRQSEDRFKRLFEDLGDAVFVTKVGGSDMGNILEVNSAAVRQTGYGKQELLKMNIIKNLYIDGSGSISVNEWEEKLRKGEIVTVTEYKKRKDGTKYWTEVIVTPITFKGERASLSINHDITERVKAEDELKKSEKKYRNLIENIEEGILSVDLNENFLFSNHIAAKIFGLSETEIIGKSIKDFTNEGEFKKIIHQTSIRSKGESGKYELTINRNDGTEAMVSVTSSPLYDDNNKHIGAFGILQDITKRKLTELKLKSLNAELASQNEEYESLNNQLTLVKEKVEKSEKKFRELYEKSGDAVLIIQNEIFIDCNRAAVDLFKFTSKEDLLNIHSGKLSPQFQNDGRDSTKKANEMMETSLKNGTHRFEWDYINSNNEVFPVEVLLTAISISAEEKIIHAVCRDITANKIAKLELIKAKENAEESDRLKSAFLANMSHEIRTPMNGILGFASLLKLPDLTVDQLKKYIEIIEKSGLRMLNIINDLIDISKIEAGQIEVSVSFCNVNNKINDLYTFFKPEANNKGLEINFIDKLPNAEAVIKTDKEKLYAILTNLIKNSIKYTHEGSINFGYKLKNDMLEFYVRDTGIGIPYNRQKAVFERFVQADIEDEKVYEGAGLGLAITKAYVEMLGGKLWLKSDENIGSEFYFSLPYLVEEKKEVALPKVVKNTESDKPIRKLKVLIAEDEEFADTYLTIILKDISYETLHAKSGDEAINLCQTHDDLDLILMDIKMPVVDGYEATRQIRKFNKKVIIIAQTAYALAGDRENALKIGCDDYIAKPIVVNELKRKIKNLFK